MKIARKIGGAVAAIGGWVEVFFFGFWIVLLAVAALGTVGSLIAQGLAVGLNWWRA